MLTQISKEEWQPLCEPIWICSLPLQAAEISENFGFEFFQVLEEGLGRVLYTYLSLSEKPILLQSCIDGPPEAQIVSVCVYGEESEWKELITKLCFEFKIKIDAVPWVQSELEEGRYELVRLDDNDNEVVMYSLPDEARAEQCRAVYESRGHKQLYSVRKKLNKNSKNDAKDARLL